MLVVEWTTHAFLFICPKVNEFWQSFNSGLILLQLWMLLEDPASLGQKVHVVD
jgi:hypothetical protein